MEKLVLIVLSLFWLYTFIGCIILAIEGYCYKNKQELIAGLFFLGLLLFMLLFIVITYFYVPDMYKIAINGTAFILGYAIALLLKEKFTLFLEEYNKNKRR
jgi:hypothetical protein